MFLRNFTRIPADPQVARIGSNLNQIARHANTEKKLDASVLSALNDSNRLLQALLEQHKN
ncbi:hypothetical protein BKE17_10045 [Enhydrobacter sp. H5]|nr:hypothetical protein BKE17_10045 [Enhydrobacter sp. H5]